MKFNVSLKSRVNQKNFGLAKVGDHVCELNDSDGVKDPDDLVTRLWLLHVCNIRQM